MPPEVPREFQERFVFFAHIIENPNGAGFPSAEPDNPAPRAAELALQRLHALDGRMKMLFEEFFENIHGIIPRAVHHRAVSPQR